MGWSEQGQRDSSEPVHQQTQPHQHMQDIQMGTAGVSIWMRAVLRKRRAEIEQDPLSSSLGGYATPDIGDRSPLKILHQSSPQLN